MENLMLILILFIPLVVSVGQNGFQYVANLDGAAMLPRTLSSRGLPPADGKQGVMLMNRIAPSSSELYIADASGSNERKLLGDMSKFDYHATFSSDGQWIVFTTERAGDGQSDLWRVHPDGTGLEELVATASMEDAGVLSPDGTKLAYVSTAEGHKTNIWVKDLTTGSSVGLTNTAGVAGDPSVPDGYFQPCWSPDGEWIAFSSDRNTQWIGHEAGLQHTQELSIYIIRPDGSDFRRVTNRTDYSLGSPKWSPDSQRIVFYEVPRLQTWHTRRPELVANATAQIVSVDVATGLDRVEHTTGPYVKMYPQYLTQDTIAYTVKAVPGLGVEGIFTTGGTSVLSDGIRSPSWSPDGAQVVYQRMSMHPARRIEKPLYSWDHEYEYRFTDVFPCLSHDRRLVFTEKQNGNSSIVVMNLDGSNYHSPYQLTVAQITNLPKIEAFQPVWSSDSEWIAFSVGAHFLGRRTGTSQVFRMRPNGSDLEPLTDISLYSTFPSYSPDGNYIVYSEYAGGQLSGLRVLNVADRTVRNLTTSQDNLPFWSPDGNLIVFSRRVSQWNFDIAIIRPDGTDERSITSNSGAHDAHGIWTEDGRVLFTSSRFGFRQEAALFDDNFQPDGQNMIMNADGTNVTSLTDSIWEESMPLYIPTRFYNTAL